MGQKQSYFSPNTPLIRLPFKRDTWCEDCFVSSTSTFLVHVRSPWLCLCWRLFKSLERSPSVALCSPCQCACALPTLAVIRCEKIASSFAALLLPVRRFRRTQRREGKNKMRPKHTPIEKWQTGRWSSFPVWTGDIAERARMVPAIQQMRINILPSRVDIRNERSNGLVGDRGIWICVLPPERDFNISQAARYLVARIAVWKRTSFFPSRGSQGVTRSHSKSVGVQRYLSWL